MGFDLFNSPPRSADRIDEVLDALREYWHAHPDYRLGQIVVNASTATRHNPDPFYMEEDTFLAGLDRLNRKEDET